MTDQCGGPSPALLTESLHRDFVDPIGPHDPLLNQLHVGHTEAVRLLGEDPSLGSLAQLMGWAQSVPPEDIELERLLTPWMECRGAELRVGLIDVRTEAKVSFLLYELKARFRIDRLATCDALTASASRAQHFKASSQLERRLGVRRDVRPLTQGPGMLMFALASIPNWSDDLRPPRPVGKSTSTLPDGAVRLGQRTCTP